MYTFDQLKEDVRKEAEALKVHATKEELERLDIDRLQAASYELCIYGLMTGNCYNDRARQLKIQSTKRFISSWYLDDTVVVEYKGVSGYSPIEAYILQYSAENANLIAFLKGESETLEL